MRLTLACLCLALGSAVSAQSPVNARYTAPTQISLFAGANTNSLPAGTDLAAPVTNLSVGTPVGLGGATSQITYSHSALTGTAIRINEQSNMLNPGESAGSGPNETVVVLKADADVPANIALSFNAVSQQPEHTSASGMVDIGDDGTFELSGALGSPASGSWVVTIPRTGLRIRTVTQTRATHPGGMTPRVQVFENLIINVSPVSRCQVDFIGGGCVFALTPIISGRMTFRDSLLVTSNTTRPGARVFTALGVVQMVTPLPNGLCTLNLAPVVLVPTTADALANTSQEFAIPPNVLGSVLIQKVIVDPFIPNQLLSTPAIELKCL